MEEDVVREGVLEIQGFPMDKEQKKFFAVPDGYVRISTYCHIDATGTQLTYRTVDRLIYQQDGG